MHIPSFESNVASSSVMSDVIRLVNTKIKGLVEIVTCALKSICQENQYDSNTM